MLELLCTVTNRRIQVMLLPFSADIVILWIEIMKKRCGCECVECNNVEFSVTFGCFSKMLSSPVSKNLENMRIMNNG